jgi:hypothetical protein
MAGKPFPHRTRQPLGEPPLKGLVVRRPPDGRDADAGEAQPPCLAAEFLRELHAGVPIVTRGCGRIDHDDHRTRKAGNLGKQAMYRLPARPGEELIWTQPSRSLSSAPIVPDGGVFPNRLQAE